jgi:RES domain-containing protein
MRIWRICRALHVPEEFSGEGARRFGGRWNLRGVPMVYASTSLALAAMELFVHLEPGLAPSDLVYISAELPAGEPARSLRSEDRPPEWWTDSVSHAITTQDLGSDWIRKASSLALLVPSVPIRSEWNVLINPQHPAIALLRGDPPQAFVFDERMFQRIVS